MKLFGSNKKKDTEEDEAKRRVEEAYQRMEDYLPANIRLLSACQDWQKAADNSDVKTKCGLTESKRDLMVDGSQGGAVTSLLLKLLYDYDRSNIKVTYSKLLLELRTQLKAINYDLVPQLSSSRPLHSFTTTTPNGTQVPAPYSATSIIPADQEEFCIVPKTIPIPTAILEAEATATTADGKSTKSKKSKSDANNNSSSSSDPITYVPFKGKRRALVIGINYEGRGQNNTQYELPGCRNDAWNICKFLKQPEQGFTDDDIIVLVDDHVENPLSYPSKQTILKEFQDLAQSLQCGDVGYIHFSGHGCIIPEGKNGEPGGHGLVPADYTGSNYIPDHELFRLLLLHLQPGVTLTVLFDCCHSGNMLHLPFCSDGPNNKFTLEQKAWEKELTFRKQPHFRHEKYIDKERTRVYELQQRTDLTEEEKYQKKLKTPKAWWYRKDDDEEEKEGNGDGRKMGEKDDPLQTSRHNGKKDELRKSLHNNNNPQRRTSSSSSSKSPPPPKKRISSIVGGAAASMAPNLKQQRNNLMESLGKLRRHPSMDGDDLIIPEGNEEQEQEDRDGTIGKEGEFELGGGGDDDDGGRSSRARSRSMGRRGRSRGRSVGKRGPAPAASETEDNNSRGRGRSVGKRGGSVGKRSSSLGRLASRVMSSVSGSGKGGGSGGDVDDDSGATPPTDKANLPPPPKKGLSNLMSKWTTTDNNSNLDSTDNGASGQRNARSKSGDRRRSNNRRMDELGLSEHGLRRGRKEEPSTAATTASGTTHSGGNPQNRTHSSERRRPGNRRMDELGLSEHGLRRGRKEEPSAPMTTTTTKPASSKPFSPWDSMVKSVGGSAGDGSKPSGTMELNSPPQRRRSLSQDKKKNRRMDALGVSAHGLRKGRREGTESTGSNESPNGVSGSNGENNAKPASPETKEKEGSGALGKIGAMIGRARSKSKEKRSSRGKEENKSPLRRGKKEGAVESSPENDNNNGGLDSSSKGNTRTSSRGRGRSIGRKGASNIDDSTKSAPPLTTSSNGSGSGLRGKSADKRVSKRTDENGLRRGKKDTEQPLSQGGQQNHEDNKASLQRNRSGSIGRPSRHQRRLEELGLSSHEPSDLKPGLKNRPQKHSPRNHSPKRTPSRPSSMMDITSSDDLRSREPVSKTNLEDVSYQPLQKTQSLTPRVQQLDDGQDATSSSGSTPVRKLGRKTSMDSVGSRGKRYARPKAPSRTSSMDSCASFESVESGPRVRRSFRKKNNDLDSSIKSTRSTASERPSKRAPRKHDSLSMSTHSRDSFCSRDSYWSQAFEEMSDTSSDEEESPTKRSITKKKSGDDSSVRSGKSTKHAPSRQLSGGSTRMSRNEVAPRKRLESNKQPPKKHNSLTRPSTSRGDTSSLSGLSSHKPTKHSPRSRRSNASVVSASLDSAMLKQPVKEVSKIEKHAPRRKTSAGPDMTGFEQQGKPTKHKPKKKPSSASSNRSVQTSATGKSTSTTATSSTSKVSKKKPASMNLVKVSVRS